MNEISDHQLLRAFALRRDEAAFRELVQRNIDLVHSAAVRQVESEAVARDLTQAVFIDLARRATDILGKHAGESLAGWLHRATRYAALNHLRDTRRRRDNEKQAMEQLLINSDASADWEEIRPALDEAIDSLDHPDREAILLRFFKSLDFRAVGDQLGVSDDTAQKRVSRAVEKLREFFAKRGASIGASGLAVAISANAVQAAPAGLVTAISTAALTGTAVASPTVIAASTKTVAMTTLQKTLVAATIAVLSGAGIYETRQAAQLRDQVQTLQQQHLTLSNQLAAALTENTQLANRAAETKEHNRLSQAQFSELLKLRGQKGQVQTAIQQLEKAQQAGQRQNQAMSSVVTNMMHSALAKVQTRMQEKAAARLARMQETLHLTDDQTQSVSNLLMQRMSVELNNQQNKLSAAMTGQPEPAGQMLPGEDSQILALLTPEQQAAYPEFQRGETELGIQEMANSEVTRLAKNLGLTSDQQSQVQSALYHYELSQQNHPSDSAVKLAQAQADSNLGEVAALQLAIEQQKLADKLKFLANILKPDQLKDYQQTQENVLEMMKSAVESFKSDATE